MKTSNVDSKPKNEGKGQVFTQPFEAPDAAKRVLIIDDDEDTLRVVRFLLEAEGYEVTTSRSSREALAWIDRHGLPHLAIVDVRMPGGDGIGFCREVQKYSDLPAIMLSAVDEEDTVVLALEEVAEDYVIKPFSNRELVARVRRVIRRLGDFAYRLGTLTVIDDRLAVDFAHKRVMIDDRPVSLTPTETKILHILIGNAQRTVTSDYLLRRIWPMEEVFEDTLRVHVHRLRQKIEPNPGTPRYLITQRGTGYSFLPISCAGP